MIQPSAYPYTFSRFLQHLREAVLYYPDSDSLKLSTFGYINSIDDLNKQNLGFTEADAKGNHCLSKRYEKKKTSLFEFDFPLLAVAEISKQGVDVFKTENRSQKVNTNLRLWVLDLADRNKEYSNNLADRHIQKIFEDTQTILWDVFNYIGSIQFYRIVNLDASISYGWYHPGVIAQLLTESKITSYQGETSNSDLVKSNTWFRTMLNERSSIQMGYQDVITDRKLAGSWADIQLTFPVCRNVTFDFDYAVNDFVYGPSH